jgi:16S rRNA C967 or C1407 C5-methylase (RsmB/RsmF family)
MESTRAVMGDERFEQYLEAFRQEAPVSIRLNPLHASRFTLHASLEPVPWCRDAYYLPTRPNFTMDPLLHAGCYYVQEAASMFLDEVLRQLSIVNCQLSIDMCAAPGGKSTLLRAALPADCVLYSNEPIRQRASILLENVTKWGYANHMVTNNYPRDYRKAKMQFDLILCDVPCSGEGMFRKDEATIREWSPQNVEKCWRLQREIVSDAWECLAPGGIIIYSTCTFNTKENEENIRWMLSEYDAEVVPVAVRPEWHITGSLLPGFDAPVYRFIPGISRGEGLFMCVLKKRGERREERGERKAERGKRNEKRGEKDNDLTILSPLSSSANLSPLSSLLSPLTYPQAIAYLRGEALVLPPETPRGLVTVTFMGHALGQVKNIGSRANNLYPKEWRIRTTHVPNEYEPII